MDAFEQDVLTVDVGGRLRQLRQERGKSMRSLARDSGLSTNALSMIERGRTSPSVSTLHKVAQALEVPITAFFRLEPPRQQVVFRKAGERKCIEFPNGTWEGLGGETYIGHLEPFMLSLEKGACSGSFGMIHTGHEFVLCLQGKLEYYIEDQKYLLEAGDSLIFSAQLRHRWCNPGDQDASALFVLAGFEQGERPSEFHILSNQKGQLQGEQGDPDENSLENALQGEED